MTREEVIKFVRESDLTEDAKTYWVNRLTDEGLTEDVVDGLKNALEEEAVKALEELGITEMPEYKELVDKATTEMEQVENDFNAGMEQNSQHITQFKKAASDVIDKVKAAEVRANIE